MPLMEVTDHDRGKALTIERWARARYGLGADAGPPRPAALAHGLPADSGESTVDALLRGPEPDWPGIRERLLAGIHAGAAPDRADRLFPGDPAGFTTGGVCAANGAAGVLYALDRVGAPVPGAYVDWLARTAARRAPENPGGLFDGLPGVALVLARLGRREEGRELLDRALRAPAPRRPTCAPVRRERPWRPCGSPRTEQAHPTRNSWTGPCGPPGNSTHWSATGPPRTVRRPRTRRGCSAGSAGPRCSTSNCTRTPARSGCCTPPGRRSPGRPGTA